MALLPAKAARPKFQNFPQTLVCGWAALTSKIIPAAGKAAVIAKPAAGGRPAIEAVPVVVAVKGVSALIPFFNYSQGGINTTIIFRLPLSAGAGVGNAIRGANLITEVSPVIAEALSFPNWYLGEAYTLQDEPSWCQTFEQFLAWVAKNCPDTTITLAANMTALDFKVILSNDDLGGVDVMLGNIAAPAAPPTPLCNVVKYTGTGVERSLDLGMTADLLLIKSRNDFGYFQIFDTVRGAGKVWAPANTAVNNVAESVKAFMTNGVTLGTSDLVNKATVDFLAYGVDQKAGSFLDIVAFTGNGANNRQIAHQLGAEPELMIVQNMTSGLYAHVYCKYYNDTTPQDYDVWLNEGRSLTPENPNVWGNTAPTSTAFTVSSPIAVADSAIQNTNDTGGQYIAYLFRSLPNASKVGGYTGDGTGNKTIECGLAPKLVILNDRQFTGNAPWYLWAKTTMDAATNTKPLELLLDTKEAYTAGGGTGATYDGPLTFGATGFSSPDFNVNAKRYVYMAFA